MATNIAAQLAALATQFQGDGFEIVIPGPGFTTVLDQNPLRVYVGFVVLTGVPCEIRPSGKASGTAKYIVPVNSLPLEFWIERHKNLPQMQFDAVGFGGGVTLQVYTVSYIGE